ncbi:hypothetical protein L6R52_43915, partial [Myxococcota bacterium]|nr:hypothetical protein [Myxococcota bacterium]
MTCPKIQHVLRLGTKTLDAATMSSTRSHAADCDECREALAALTRAKQAVLALDAEPTAVDLARIGAGLRTRLDEADRRAGVRTALLVALGGALTASALLAASLDVFDDLSHGTGVQADLVATPTGEPSRALGNLSHGTGVPRTSSPITRVDDLSDGTGAPPRGSARAHTMLADAEHLELEGGTLVAAGPVELAAVDASAAAAEVDLEAAVLTLVSGTVDVERSSAAAAPVQLQTPLARIIVLAGRARITSSAEGTTITTDGDVEVAASGGALHHLGPGASLTLTAAPRASTRPARTPSDARAPDRARAPSERTREET